MNIAKYTFDICAPKFHFDYHFILFYFIEYKKIKNSRKKDNTG